MRRACIRLVALSFLLLSACNLVLGMDALDSGGPDSGGTDAGGSSANAGTAGTGAAWGMSGGATGGPVIAGGFTGSGTGGQGGGGSAGSATQGGNAGSATGGGNAGSATEGGNAGSAGHGGVAGATGVPFSDAGGYGGSAGAGGTGGASGIGTPCSTQSPDASCSCVGYAAHDYWFCSAYLTFEAAENKCQAVSMHLPKVETQAEDTFLFDTGADKHMGEYFLGAIDPAYSHWSANQPDGSGDCTVVQINGPWDDRTCFDQRKYICEGVRAP